MDITDPGYFLVVIVLTFPHISEYVACTSSIVGSRPGSIPASTGVRTKISICILFVLVNFLQDRKLIIQRCISTKSSSQVLPAMQPNLAKEIVQAIKSTP
ncbi:hypothetical protein GGS21DRAFT_369232 [Xylaria nigripes]|nr:hypothetical protein GGS21DRAFT_369232 [Xylaria nigripes]